MKSYAHFSLIILCLCFILNFLDIKSEERPVLIVLGTRPEAIKMIPVYSALKDQNIPVVLCTTGQHRELVDSIFELFNIHPDIDLNIMKEGQDLFHITTQVITQMKQVIEDVKPSLLLVQGDTTSAMASALAAFYLKIPIGHVEAGLRTGNMQAPFPEEFNRKSISIIADYHFAPTQLSFENLVHEGINVSDIYCVGNTVVDAVLMGKNKIAQRRNLIDKKIVQYFEKAQNEQKKIIVLTVHRRESFGQELKNIFCGLKESLINHSEIQVIYPMHPNPCIKKTFDEVDFNAIDNIVVTKPLGYLDMIYLLDNADLILTDSGGIQEEGVSLEKPVFVLRNETDRPEGLVSGGAKLVGTQKKSIVEEIDNFLLCHGLRKKLSLIYGNGKAGIQIAEKIKHLFYSIKD